MISNPQWHDVLGNNVTAIQAYRQYLVEGFSGETLAEWIERSSEALWGSEHDSTLDWGALAENLRVDASGQADPDEFLPTSLLDARPLYNQYMEENPLFPEGERKPAPPFAQWLQEKFGPMIERRYYGLLPDWERVADTIRLRAAIAAALCYGWSADVGGSIARMWQDTYESRDK